MPDATLQQELWAAIADGNCETLRELVARGADLNTANPAGETPLMRAVTGRNTALLRTLTTLGADVNLPCGGPKSWTPLMFAHDNPEMIRELVAAGADVNARTKPDWIKGASDRFIRRPGGETALHLAAARGQAAAVRELLRAGAAVEAQTEDGRAPLDYAIQFGAVNDAAEALVEGGAQLTPERLDLMHSSAHNPDADLLGYPFATDYATAGPGAARQSVPPNKATGALPNESAEKRTELRCPRCHALIYSRKPKMCGQCGCMLPRELLLDDAEAQAVADERQWARDLAAKFGENQSPKREPPVAGPNVAAGEAVAPEQMLRRVSCVEEFRHRDRPTFWLYLAAYGFLLFMVGYVPFRLGFMPPAGLVMMAVLFAFPCVRAWFCASPICPNCHQDIRLCSPVYCHVCGKSLQNGRCASCAVDYTWTGFLNYYKETGNLSWIAYCPGCGVRLDSKVLRWRPGH